MTDKQQRQAVILSYYPFDADSFALRFVRRMAYCARNAPDTELTNEDAKYLARLYETYHSDMQTEKQP